MITEKKYNTSKPKDFFYSLAEYHRTIVADMHRQTYKYLLKEITPTIFVGLDILSILEANISFLFTSILHKPNYEYVGKLFDKDVYLNYNINTETVIIGNSAQEIINYILTKQRKLKLDKLK